MEWWQILLVSILGAVAALLAAALLLWWLAGRRTRALSRRISRLPWRAKVALAGGLMRDERIPTGVRLIPALLVLYLALPLDLIPDFIPVLGQVDDILVLLAGTALLMRFAPMRVIEEHIAAFEAAPEYPAPPEPKALPPATQ